MDDFGESVEGPNTALIDQLLTTAHYYEIVAEPEWERRKIAYLNAIPVIKGLRESLIDKAEAIKLPNIGDSISTDVEEFALYGKTAKLEELKRKAGESAKYIELFKSVFGIGIVTAIRLYRRGYRTLEQLLNGGGGLPPAPLTNSQLLGLKYYDDINRSVPRETIKSLLVTFESISLRIGCSFDVVGSFRRGELQSSDVDILVTGTTMSEFIGELSREKETIKLAQGERKFMGIILTNVGYRRIDVRVFSREEYPTALLYFTGSARFNILMRLRAISITLKLNEYGLYYYDDTRVPILSEVDVFAALNTVYLSPEQRTKDIPSLQFGTAYDQIIAQLAAQKKTK